MVITKDNETFVFQRGIYRTSSKEEVRKLLASPEYQSDYFELHTPKELVDSYLKGEEPDKLTEPVLNKLTAEGLNELSKYFGFKEDASNPAIIKAMCQGKNVDNKVKTILDRYEAESEDEQVEDLLQRGKDCGAIYRRGAWWKLRSLVDQKDPENDTSLGQSDEQAHRAIEERRDTVLERIKQFEQTEKENA